MPSKTYYLDNDPTKPLVTHWGFGFKNFTLIYKGKTVGTLATQKELKAGKECILPNGAVLAVKLSGFFQPQVVLQVDGKAVPGSSTDPLEVLKQLNYLALFLGGLNIAMGLAAELLHVEMLLALGMDYFTILVGVLILLLGYAARHQFITAIICLVILQALDIVNMLIISSQGTNSPPTVAIIFKVFIISYFLRGIGAIKTLNKEKKAFA